MKVVYDTCLYIDLLRAEGRLDMFQLNEHTRYLSPIVVMELNAGAATSKQQAVLDKLYRPYAKAGRFIKMEPDHFYQAGRLLSKMRERRDQRSLSHDILIAISASAAGAAVFTSNKRDFELIRKYVPLKLIIV